MKVKKYLKRFLCAFICLCCLSILGNVIYAQEQVMIETEEVFEESIVENESIAEMQERENSTCTYVIQAFCEPEIIIYDVEKTNLSDLTQQFPDEIEVVLNNEEVEWIQVSWQCDVDYESTNESTYQFDVVLPEGYEVAEGVEGAFIGVVLKGAYDINPTVHFEENENGITLDAYLGATGIVEHLNSHRNDGYYIGTPYAGWSSGNANWVCMTPNGALYNGWYAGMNCTGFVQYVLQACGGDWTKINAQGNCNLSAWTYAMLYNNLDDQIKVWKFNSKEEMLASGKLMKGDIILMEPTYADSWSGAKDEYGNAIDCHIGFYWGDDTNNDMFWHSSHATYGLGCSIIDGPSNGAGNQISNITPKCSGNVFYVFPINHQGYIQVSKTFSEGNDSYNPDSDPAQYTIYSDAACTIPAETLVGASTFRVESDLKTGVIPIKAGTYYIKETRSPSGWDMDTNVYMLKVTDEHMTSSPATVSSTNTKKVIEVPRSITLTKSINVEEINFANGNPSFIFKLDGVDVDGKRHTYRKLLVFTPDFVLGKSGKISLSVTFDHLAAGTYTASEEIVARYHLESITDVHGGQMSGESVVFDLAANTNGTATFHNKLMEHGWFSGNSSVINSIEILAK